MFGPVNVLFVCLFVFNVTHCGNSGLWLVHDIWILDNREIKYSSAFAQGFCLQRTSVILTYIDEVCQIQFCCILLISGMNHAVFWRVAFMPWVLCLTLILIFFLYKKILAWGKQVVGNKKGKAYRCINAKHTEINNFLFFFFCNAFNLKFFFFSQSNYFDSFCFLT